MNHFRVASLEEQLFAWDGDSDAGTGASAGASGTCSVLKEQGDPEGRQEKTQLGLWQAAGPSLQIGGAQRGQVPVPLSRVSPKLTEAPSHSLPGTKLSAQPCPALEHGLQRHPPPQRLGPARGTDMETAGGAGPDLILEPQRWKRCWDPCTILGLGLWIGQWA